ncbi:MAG: hypothetical protein KDD33_02980 [Bdellovibrionales bacterium]|nr:hypothetical protein [Bdellovibrionales bacterium]
MLKWILSFFILASTSGAQPEKAFVFRQDHLPTHSLFRVPEDGLRVLWWNLGCSRKLSRNAQMLANKNDFLADHQWENLKQFMDSPQRPDVLILGEFCPSNFDKKTLSRLNKIYPHRYKIDKTNPQYDIRNGLRVFSLYPLELLEKVDLDENDFTNSSDLTRCQSQVKKDRPKAFQKGFWKRPLPILSVRTPDGEITLAPTHLANPWTILNVCTSAVMAGRRMIFDRENVNAAQALQLTEELASETPLLLIGDFNTPKKFFGMRGYGYSVMEGAFGPSQILDSQNTYIDAGTSLKSASIDHAFTQGLYVSYARVWPLAGSDHLPIYIVVKPKH